MDDELIKFEEVHKQFGKRVVLDSVTLRIPEGKIIGIVGASGEGKTTILKILVGFYKPSAGRITYAKHEVSQEKDLRKLIGFATEDGSFHETLTVLENLYHFAELHHVKRKVKKKRAEELMELVGLTYAKRTLAKNLSMGMKKRLDVAISLMHDPKILIMDEPTADLDPILRRDMLNLIRKINKQDTTVILTTQLLSEMDEVCDRIAILFNRNIIVEGDPKKIKKKYKAGDLNEVFNAIFSNRHKAEVQTGLTKEQIEAIQAKIDAMEKESD